MRYLIKRRNRRIALLFILLAVTFLLAVPRVYKKSIVQEKDIIFRDRPYKIQEDFSGYLLDSKASKGNSLDLHFLNDGYVFSELNIRDLDIRGTIVSADVIVKGKLIKDERNKFIGFSGKLFSRGITLDSKPLMALNMSFKITKDELEIRSLRFGKSYELKGSLSLVQPFETELQLEIMRADIRDLAVIAKAKNPDVVLGIMRGVFHVKGTLANLFSNGILESRNGRIGPIGYDIATIRFEGFGPVINIVDSSVKQGKSTMTMEGYIDLRNIAKGNLFDGLRIRSDMKTIVWDGWDITENGTDELSMTKGVSDNMRVGFKTMAREPLTTYYDKENPEEMSLEYKMGLENLKMKLKDKEEFFGIEHNIRF